MGTEEFLSCLSKAEIEEVASANGILPKPTGKATRAAVISHFKDGDYTYPRATFGLSPDEVEAHAEAGKPRSHSWEGDDGDENAETTDPDSADLEDAA
jgi:ParB family transcriptional regulator, chromosome partitioning protein